MVTTTYGASNAYKAAVSAIGDILDDLQYVLNKLEKQTEIQPVTAMQIAKLYEDAEKLTAAM